jgi:heme-degrading monooxygenase HmoA
MFAVIFEVEPWPHRFEGYLEIARMLRPELETIDGFLENTRFRSRTRDGLLLSLSLWRDEKAVIRWRTHAGHYAAQALGRREILSRYRLRVGEVSRFMEKTGEAALPQQRFDETATGEAKAVAFVLGRAPGAPGPAPGDAVEGDVLDGIVDASQWAALTAFRTGIEAARHIEGTRAGGERRLAVRVIRDYGLLDRREAPQFHEPVVR